MKKQFLTNLVAFCMLLANIRSISGQLEKPKLPRRIPGLNLRDVVDRKYSPRFFNGTWISDNSFKYFHDGSLYVYNVTDQKRVLKYSNITTLAESEGDFQFASWSSDGEYALYYAQREGIYRHSSKAKYKVLNLKSRQSFDLYEGNPLQLVEWSLVGHDLVFVKDNNIYHVEDEFKSTKALATNGVKGVLFNGVADWVYEEEVFSDTKALWFSTDSKLLAFIQLNDSSVHDLSYVHYGKPGDKSFQYPDVVTLKYPKAGTSNPRVQLHVLSIDHGFDLEIIFDNLFTFKGEVLVTDVSWTKQNNLLVTWTNRVQNVSNTFLCKLNMKNFLRKLSDCRLVLEMSEPSGWVELSNPVLSANESRVLYILPLVQQDFKRYPQLVLRSSEDQQDLPLTQGQITVTEILAWDESKDVIFYKAVRASHSSELHVYMVQIHSRQSFCLSCDLTERCGYASVSFSQDFTYYALTCKGPRLPFVMIHYTYAAYQKPILTWEENNHLLDGLEDLSLPLYEKVNVPLPDGHEALVQLTLPKQMDRSGRLKYPVLLNVYGGPGSNIIEDRFSIDFHSYLVSTRHVIVVHIDARGSAYRSKEQEFAVNRNLGRYEVQDQISVVKYLTEKYQFMDKTRVGIWGWSYGGFTTAMVLATDKTNVFQCGASVAPVTNFLNYDSIYTERYMGLPSENEAAYNWTDVSNKVDNFANKSFLLMHGSADDNVHYQHSMMLTEALEAKDIFFYQQTYPDQAHGIQSYRHHVFETINHFFSVCFKFGQG